MQSIIQVKRSELDGDRLRARARHVGWAAEDRVPLHLTLVLPRESGDSVVTLCEALLGDVALVAGDDGVLVEAVRVAPNGDVKRLHGLVGHATEVEDLTNATLRHASRVKRFARNVACVT